MIDESITDTLRYYEENAGNLYPKYETVDMTHLHDLVRQHFAEECRILEIGCGSGRDTAAFLQDGYDVAALDGSREMLLAALRLHPQLSGRTVQHNLPERLPFPDSTFSGAYSSAVMMHFSKPEIETIFGEVLRILAPGSHFIFSVSIERADIDSSGRDTNGRRFTILSIEEWENISTNQGFEIITVNTSSDSAGRKGISWASFVCRKPGM
jgi:SAM-dependent methyltransferase